jgi:hypothetical protein
VPSGPIKDYDQHYATHDTTPAQLWVDVGFLRALNRFGEVEKALQGYLTHHRKRAEPWMYLLLALSFEINGRGPEAVHTALGWAGYQARKQDDPFTLIEVADVLLLRGIEEVTLPGNIPPVRTGELLDQAAAKAPHRPEPILMSILLAEKTGDPNRMAAAVERLMALGWPGVDEEWRREARHRAEALAARLREQQRASDAESLLGRVAQAERRDLFLRLTWKGDAGLDLEVEEPLGAKATAMEPRTVFGGAIVKSGRGKHPESVYTCPLGFDGPYKVRVVPLYSNEKDPAREVTLEIVAHEGSSDERREARPIHLDSRAPIVVELTGGRRTRVLPMEERTRLIFAPDVVADERPRAAPNAATPGAATAAEALRGPGTPKARPEAPPTIRPDAAPRRSGR